jgi:hypothetical protein
MVNWWCWFIVAGGTLPIVVFIPYRVIVLYATDLHLVAYQYVSLASTKLPKSLPNFLARGWSEPAATSAPVQDEAVQAVLGMNQKTYPFPLPRDFSAPFFAPKFSYPTYLPPFTSLTSFPSRSLQLQSSGELPSLSST